MINKAILLGKIVEREYRLTKDKIPILSITLETRKKYSNHEGEEKEETTWHMVNFFDQVAIAGNHISSKEDIAYIEGEIINRKVNGKMVNSIKGNLIQIVKKDKE
jgi:single-stranded DNA-binding protein